MRPGHRRSGARFPRPRSKSAPAGPKDEYLKDYKDLVAWSRAAGLITDESARCLLRSEPGETAAAHIRAVALREALHSIFRAAAGSEPLPQAALDELTRAVRETVSFRHLGTRDGRLCCTWDFCQNAPLALLGPIAWPAMDLLESGPLERIRECPPPDGCGWLFLDASKNRSRHWCSMKTCGNAAKARRFRQRRAAAV
ncbi:MAG: hypothetical protein FJ191_08455 [Gammaproteobacteria bacterium]|nr:hypothetical protein [Gammaproteobacteria bacterium]